MSTTSTNTPVEPLNLKYSNSQSRPYKVLDWFYANLPNPKAELGPAFWRIVDTEWSGFDAIPHNEYRKIFRMVREHNSPDLWLPENRKMYEALPKSFEVYRGTDAKAAHGLSWTLDYDTAKGFARGHRGMYNKHPMVLKAIIRKTSVALVQADREEQEIVLYNPPQRKGLRSEYFKLEDLLPKKTA